MTMSDRLAVLVNGRVEQVGTPSEVYSQPATTYVAGFLGTANLYEAKVIEVNDDVAVCELGQVRLLACAAPCAQPGSMVSLAVRPERVEVSPPDDTQERGGNVLAGTVDQLVFLGAQTQVSVQLGGCLMVAEIPNVHGALPDWLHEKRSLCVRISPGAVRLLPLGRPASEATA